MSTRFMLSAALLALLLVSPPSTSRGDDWPQWLGPQRDSVWREEGIVDRFPAEGPKVKWRAPVGLGYSGPAVVGDRVFVMDYEMTDGKITNKPGGRDKLTGRERIVCLDAETGKQVWTHAYDRPYAISYPRGPRCTPAVVDGRVYTLGAEGDLLCLDAGSGSVVWQKNFKKEYGAETPIWGHSAHPLVDGDAVFCLVGGAGSVAVAFDRHSGQELWRALSAREPGYCPPTMIEHGGRKQLVIWHPEAINGLDPATGKVHWSVPLAPDYGMSIMAPRLAGDLLFASGIGNAGALLKLATDKPAAEVVWRGEPKTAVYCANSTPFIEGETIYGCDCRTGSLMGVRLEDGERLWETWKPTSNTDRRAAHGTAFLVKQGNRFFLMSETGDLIVAKLSPQGYEELDRFHLLDATNDAFGRAVVWSHPAFARKSVFARNDKELVCASLAAE